MRRAATSAFVMKLVPPRSTEVIQVRGRDHVARRGIYFALIGRHRRSVYQQLDGKVELADVCTCRVDWSPDLAVTHSVGCAIDEHKRRALDDEWGAA